jgi:hypothetical protein
MFKRKGETMSQNLGDRKASVFLVLYRINYS